MDAQEAVVADYSFTTEAHDDVNLGVLDDDAAQEPLWNPKSIEDLVPIGKYGFTGDLDRDRDRIGRMQAYQQRTSGAELDLPPPQQASKSSLPPPQQVSKSSLPPPQQASRSSLPPPQCATKPDPQPPQRGLTVMMCLTLLFAALDTTVFDLIAAVVPNITITKKPSNFIWVTFVALMVLAMLSQAEAGVTPTVPASMVSPSLFMADTTSGRLAQPDHEWCSDSGTNRFVTNDERDFVPGTIVYRDTVVSVGGGNVTSPMHGTVLIKSLDHGVTISCSKVLLIRGCA